MVWQKAAVVPLCREVLYYSYPVVMWCVKYIIHSCTNWGFCQALILHQGRAIHDIYALWPWRSLLVNLPQLMTDKDVKFWACLTICQTILVTCSANNYIHTQFVHCISVSVCASLLMPFLFFFPFLCFSSHSGWRSVSKEHVGQLQVHYSRIHAKGPKTEAGMGWKWCRGGEKWLG